MSFSPLPNVGGLRLTTFARLILFTFALLVLSSFVLQVQRAQAFTFNVVNLNDSGSGSLRDAITNANATLGADNINILTSGTVNLLTALPTISDDVSITGPGPTAFILQRQAGAPNFRIFTIGNNEIVTISGMTIAGGSLGTNCCNSGGGIYNDGILTLTNVTVRNNIAYYGGGIYNNRTMTINSSSVYENLAQSLGGGIYGNGTINSSTIRDNDAGNGAGLYGTLTLNNSAVLNNQATGYGGGLFGTVTLNTTTVAGNTAGEWGGGIYGGGGTINFSMITSNIAAEWGGGLYQDCCGTWNINYSTIANNSSGRDGGGIYNENTLNLVNSTVSGNQATGSGGGIFGDGTATLTNVTIVGNIADTDNNDTGTGGGVYRFDSTFTIRNSIISGNRRRLSGTVNSDCDGAVVLAGVNLLGQNNNANGCPSAGPNVLLLSGPTSLAVNTVLANNGGSTFTHAVPLGSPAINAGSNAVIPAGVTTDQRGTGFARIVGGVVDIGAVEYVSGVPIPPANTNLLYDGTFDFGFTYWAAFNGLASQFVNGVFEFWRWQGSPDAGFYQFNPNSAPAGTTFRLTFTVANSSNRFKTMSLMVRHPDWSNNRICFVALPANLPSSNLTMLARATNDWPQIVVQAYVLQADGAAAVRLDNLNLQYVPGLSVPADNISCPAGYFGTETLSNGAAISDGGLVLPADGGAPQGMISEGGIVPLPSELAPVEAAAEAKP